MPKVWVVRADGGAETQNCVDGGFTGIGWHETGDLSDASNREVIAERWDAADYSGQGPVSRGMDIGNITRFVCDIQVGDWIITPEGESRWLRYGEVTGGYQFLSAPADSCTYKHRRLVRWEKEPLDRWELSGRAQDSLKSALTVYSPSHRADLFEAMGKHDLAVQATSHDDTSTAVTAAETVLDRLHELNPYDFEKLVEHLLSAMGFEETKTTRRSGDGGIDVTGTLNISNMIRLDVYSQVKRFKRNKRVGERDVRELRAVIPFGAQGAFFTTGKFAKPAVESATDPRFVRIGLVDGSRLVELLTQHWARIPPDFRSQLGLDLGLIPA